MKNILYLMHVNWNWIKQRPQFIAEGLSDSYNITVMYKHTFNKKGYQNKRKDTNRHNLFLKQIYTVPNKFVEHSQIFNKINDMCFKSQINYTINNIKPEIIYFTHPTYSKYVSKEYKGTIVYDCMDDHIALEKNKIIKKEIFNEEKKLINISDIILVSSSHLLKVLKSRYNLKNKKIEIVRNGFQGPIISKNILNSVNVPNNIISYFGTISRWFDFETLKKSLIDFPTIQYNLYGPIDKSIQLPKNERIHYMGTVEHDKLYETIRNSRVLIMPFLMTPIVESVDPVKLYEYINFYKDILTIKYEEIDRFKNYVYFYNNYEEFKEQLQKILKSSDPRYSLEKRKEFLMENTWNNRIIQIKKILNSKG